MCSLDLDVCPVWREEVVQAARKEHECDSCGASIPAGTSYLRHASVFDGALTSEKMCAACWFLREDFAQAHGQACTPSVFMEMLRDCIQGERSSEWRPHLAAIMRRWRVSAGGRAALQRRVFRVAIQDSLRLTARFVREVRP